MHIKPEINNSLGQMFSVFRIFFFLDSISRQVPGRKDYVSVRSEGKKMKLQKRHIMWSLKEVYDLFRNEHPTCNIKISLSKFCSLRPVHVLLSSAIPRDVCLCQYHENIRMLYECIAKEITTLPPYSEALVENVVCDSTNEFCMTGKCTKCSICNSYTIVPDDHSHEKKSVVVFMDKVLSTFVKGKNPNVEEVHIFSDGPSSQFKNKLDAYLRLLGL